VESHQTVSEPIVLLLSLLSCLVIAYFHARLGKLDKPIWPVKFMIWLISYRTQHSTYRNYGNKRKMFFFREQYMAAALIWFWICTIFILVLWSLIVKQ
jgi:predicted membrane protein